MPGHKFQLLPINNSSTSKKLQYIFHSESGMKIIVYPLFLNPDFKETPGEMCLYGQLFKWWHAFETSGFQEHQLDIIPQALSWYANRVFYPQMQPQAIDPRKAARHIIN